MKRRLATLAGAVALVAAVAGGAAIAGGFGTFAVDVIGGGSQQGSATITGVCQNSEPVTLEFATGYVDGGWVFDGISLTGINAACVAGVLVVNGTSNELAIEVTAGSGWVPLDPPYGLGSIDQLDVLLTE